MITLNHSGLYRKALNNAGYRDVETTEENVRQCFMDYVDCGQWQDLTLEDCEDIDTVEMARALAKL